MKMAYLKKGLHIAAMALMVFYFSGFVPLVSAPKIANAADTGYKSPTANASNANGDDWSDPQKAYSDGNGYAYEENNESHRYYNFNFNVPSESTINGVKVKADARSTDGSGCKLGVDLSWDNGSSWVTEKTVWLTGTEITHNFGDTNDTWGRTWSSADFSNSNFRLRVHDIDPGNNCSNDRITKLDWIRVLVDYTEAPAPICGDGNIDTNLGEQCDDSNTANGDGCSSTCQSEFGSITVTKDSVPDHAQDVNFTFKGVVNGVVTNTPFTLDDDPGDATLSNSRTFSNLATESYRIEETAVSGWYSPSISCTGIDSNRVIKFPANPRLVQINLRAGEQVTCTYTNTYPFCGDGNIDTNLGEQCDDGNDVDTDSCNNQCQTNFCGDNIVNNGEICDEGDANGQAGHCNQSCTDYVPNPAIIDTYKIICPTETVLPDWGTTTASKPSSITDWVESGDIYTWVEENGCEFSKDWNFEWAYAPEDNPGNNNENNTDTDWNVFNVSTPVELSDLGNGQIWVREQVDPAYISFDGATSTTEKKVSAEMYCHDDILNYDNYDWIGQRDPLEYGETYNCVAFNVLDQGTVTFEKDVRWNNPDKDISDNTSFGVKADDEYLGDVSENSPLSVELPTGTYNASEVLPDGYEMTNGGGEFTVETGSQQTIKFTNKTMCEPGEGWAYSVVEVIKGTTKIGGSIATDRSDPMDAVGPADTVEPQLGNFYSLGKGGSLTLAFEGTVKDVDGADLSFHEDTWGNRNSYPEEKAMVEVSYDGTSWFNIETVSSQPESSDGITYLDINGVLPVIKYVRLTDTTDFGPHTNDADGYDLDAVDVTYGYCKDVAPSYIQGKKFNDTDYNGVRDSYDTFMDGWTIRLYEQGDGWQFVDEMVTGDDSTEAGNVAVGQYRFSNLYPGTYYACEVQQDGWYQTRPSETDENKVVENQSGATDEAQYCFEVKITNDGQAKTGKQFGNARLLNLHGYKWHDINANGYRDCVEQQEENNDLRAFSIRPSICQEYAEDLLPDWTIFIDENGNQSLDDGEKNTKTSNDINHLGWYWFEGLEAGTYSVCEQVQEGWQQTSPHLNYGTTCHTVTLPYGNDGDTCYGNSQPNAVESSQECNFGNRLTPVLDIQKSVLVNGVLSETANEGDTLSYTITVANNGDETAYNLLVEDTTPTNTTLVNPSGDLATATFSGDTFKWGPFDLLGSETKTFTFDVTVNAGLPVGINNITNQATLWRMEEQIIQTKDEYSFFQKLLGVKVANAQVAEPTLILVASSNVVLTTVTIAEVPETPETPETPVTPTTPETPGKVLGDTTAPVLTITKTADVEYTNPKGAVNYTITIKNTGDGQALDVILKDTLPAGFTFEDGSSNKTWNLGALDVNGTKTVTYTATVGNDLESGDYINTAVVSAENHDNVTATHEVEVRIPKVLGDSVPDTGATARDYIVFLASIILIGFGMYLFNRDRLHSTK